jgi:hypothetical protein
VVNGLAAGGKELVNAQEKISLCIDIPGRIV